MEDHRSSSASFFSQPYSSRASLVSTASFTTSIATDFEQTGALSHSSDPSVDKDGNEKSTVNPLASMSGLRDALSLMDTLTVQAHYRTQLFAYRDMAAVKSYLPKCDDRDDLDSIKEGSLCSSNRGPLRMSARQTHLLIGMSHASHAKLETASEATDDHETMSLATVRTPEDRNCIDAGSGCRGAIDDDDATASRSLGMEERRGRRFKDGDVLGLETRTRGRSGRWLRQSTVHAACLSGLRGLLVS